MRGIGWYYYLWVRIRVFLSHILPLKPSTHWWQETLSCADDKTRNLSHDFPIQWVLMTRILVVTTSAVFVALSLKTQGRDKNPTTCSWHSAYALYRIFGLTGPELGTRQATTRISNLVWYSYPAPWHKQVPVLCFNFFFPRIRAVFSLHIFFFIGNFIFHLSLELLRKFGKMRLKVA